MQTPVVLFWLAQFKSITIPDDDPLVLGVETVVIVVEYPPLFWEGR